jgi:mono/diheme cytochrome c family protein
MKPGMRQLGIGCVLAAGMTLAWTAVPTAFVRSVEKAPTEKKPGPDASAGKVRPLMARYCFSCHGEKKPRGGLNLAALQGKKDAPVDLSQWKHVWDRLRSRQMPPSNRPQPTPREREHLAAWIEGILARHTLDGHPDPGPLHPRRLNVREYRNILRDLVVAKPNAQPRRASFVPRADGRINLYQIYPPPEHPCAFVSRILPQDTSEGGFDTIGENLSIPPFLMEKYFRCTKILLDDLFSVKGKDRHGRYQWSLRELVEKAHSGPHRRGVTPRQALVRCVQEFASRAFRRPVTADEVQKYLGLYDLAQRRGEDFETSIRLTLQAILVSPRFVVLWSEPTAEEQGKKTAPVQPLNDHDLATRLSLFLWSSVPDRELAQAAAAGRLQDPEIVEQQVRRMLKDRRITDGLVEGFLCQWLQLDRLERSSPDAERYASYFQNNLAELMTRELVFFADAILVEDRSILEFIDADWGFLCYQLAQHYGVKDFRGKKPPSNALPPWYRVQYTDKRRGGVLTMGKVLTGTSQPLRTSPVHRGKWVLETILGTPPPPPPPDVDNVLRADRQEGSKNLTVPQLLARHRANPACASCHRMIDPLGMAFETFDPVGQWRDRDQEQPIDAAGTLTDGTEFKGIEGLKALLVERKDDFVRCLVEKMLTYALGRKLEYYDMATVKEISRAVARDGYRFSRVVVEVAKSYPFRHRRTRE